MKPRAVFKGLASSRRSGLRPALIPIIIAVLIGVDVATVHAQQQGKAADWALEEIVVTARKRDESLKEVPISITAFNRDILDRQGGRRLKDLQYAIPSLTFNGPPSNADPVITIRGVSAEVSNAGFESSLSVYVDDVHQGRPTAFNQDLDQVESVQILRGPQGTFFGRNSTAGAIVIKNPVPGDEVAVDARMEYSSFDTLRLSGALRGPLQEGKLYGSVSAFSVDSDGYMDNQFNGDTVNNEGAYGANIALRTVVSEALEILLRADMMVDRREFTFAEQTTPGLLAPVVPGRFTINADGDLDEERDIGGVSVRFDLDVGADFSLTSISAWRFADTLNRGDVDGGPIRALNQTFEEQQWQGSQELRLVSPSQERLSYVVGVYYFIEEIETDRQFDVDQNLLDEFGVPPFLNIPPPATQVFLEGIGDVETETAAVFAHATYQMSEQWSVNIGGRYTEEEKTVDFEQIAPFPLMPIFNQIDFTGAETNRESDFSPTVGLAYDVNEAVRLYGQATKGFKGGGWNLGIQTTGNNPGTISGIAFGPETIWNYEFGMRSSWRDGQVILNLTGFYMDYKDLQVRQFDPTAGIARTTNAGAATSKGAEVEFVAKAHPTLAFSAGLGYLDATFDRFRNANGPGVDFDGNRLGNAPRHTAATALDWNYVLHNQWTLSARAALSYRSKTYFDSRNDEERSQGGYSLVNSRIGVVAPNGDWEIFLWGRNLTDKNYVSVSTEAFFGGLLTNYGLERTYGLEVRYKN